LFHLFLYHLILFIQSAFSACHFSSLPLISSLTAANYFLISHSPFSLPLISFLVCTLFSSLIPAVPSLISVNMVFISLSISLLLFPSSLLLADLLFLELFLNGFVPSSDVLPSSLFLSCCYLSLLSAISSCPLLLARCLLLITSHLLVVVYVSNLCSPSLPGIRK
jgi:hypothetical protein